MEISHRHENGIDIFNLGGRVGVSAVPELQNILTGAIESGARRIVIDFSSTLYLSSTGLGVFALALKLLQPLGGEMVFAAANYHVQHILQIVHFEKLFRTFPDVREAIGALESRKSAGSAQ
jgi:anti-sigma B factor antagonist